MGYNYMGCKLNLKFAMECLKFGRSFTEIFVIKLDRYVLCFVFLCLRFIISIFGNFVPTGS